MRAVCWHGKHDVRVERVPDPEILNPRDAIVRDHADRDLRLGPAPLRRLHPDDGEGRHPRPRVHGRGRRGRAARCKNLKVGDRVVVPFTIACGNCFFCQRAALVAVRQLEPERVDGGEAVRLLAGGPLRLLAPVSAATPAARRSTRACRSPTSGRSRCPTALTDEQVLFLSDIFPTGYMAAENCDIQPGDTVAVWGCGPVGQFAIAERLSARRRARHRHRPLPGAAAHGARRRRRGDDQLRGGRRARGAAAR